MADKTILNVEGMTCSNCAQGITRFLEKKGLGKVNVDFSSGEVTFEEVSNIPLTEVVKGINNLGYHVVEKNEDGVVTKKEGFLSTIQSKFIFCAIFTLPLLAHMFVDIPALHNPWVQLALCTPVFLAGISYFGKSAWSSLKTGVPNMDVLIMTGSAAAFIYSISGMLNPDANASHYLFFETTATIITLVLLGNLIEKKSVAKTTSSLRELVALQPQVANKITISKKLVEEITQVDISQVRKNDAVIVNDGGVIPVDGKIYFGTAAVDESSLTGESIPVDKSEGDLVMAGSVLMNGSLKIVTEKAGSSTVLSNIIELVRQAQSAKPAIQKLGDKISAWFVPFVICISIVTFIAGYFFFQLPPWKAMMHGIAVLVISCPCAMGLATPTAVAVGLGKAARKGILVKGGATLEMFSNIKTAVFDKTGTLTTGKFKIAALDVFGEDVQKIKNIVYSLELHSSHPIAVSIASELKSQVTSTINFEKVTEEKGSGITAEDSSGNLYSIGSWRSHQHLTNDASHQVYLSVNKNIVATINLEDEIRDGAAELISWLKSEGIQPVMVSGDNAERCQQVAAQTGITEVHSNCLPAEKTLIIESLKSKGRVMMTGDGINDAPSLAAADIGISFGDATKIAINSAQVILLNNQSLLLVREAVRTGRLTLTTIRQNLFWAFFYNVVAIPVAAMGYLSPMIAALSMAFSDVIVIGNSIRLRFRK